MLRFSERDLLVDDRPGQAQRVGGAVLLPDLDPAEAGLGEQIKPLHRVVVVIVARQSVAIEQEIRARSKHEPGIERPLQADIARRDRAGAGVVVAARKVRAAVLGGGEQGAAGKAAEPDFGIAELPLRRIERERIPPRPGRFRSPESVRDQRGPGDRECPTWLIMLNPVHYPAQLQPRLTMRASETENASRVAPSHSPQYKLHVAQTLGRARSAAQSGGRSDASADTDRVRGSPCRRRWLGLGRVGLRQRHALALCPAARETA